MRNANILRYIAVFTLVFLAFSSVSMGAEKLSQDEIDEFIRKVEEGDAEAQCQLGLMYLIGKNVKQDYEQAHYWLKKSAEQGNNLAIMTLAQMYVKGTGGVQQDYEQAEFWLKKLAENGDEKMKEAANETLKEIRSKNSQHSSSTTQTQTPPKSASDSVIEVGINQLLQEHEDNKIAAKRKYNGKRIRLSGFIFDIAEDKYEEVGKIFVCLTENKEEKTGRMDDWFHGVKFYFNDEEQDESFMKLKEGQNATIDGICETYETNGGSYRVRVQNSRVVSPNSSSTSQASEHSSSQAQISTANNAVALSEPRNFDEAKVNAVTFLNSIEEVAEKLIATDTYNVQDIEVMPADEYREESETVYMRAWYNEKYFMFSNYANSPRPVACFRTYSPEHVFAGGIKVGSSFNEIRYLFGDSGSWNAEDNTLYVNVDSSEANIHFNSGRVDYIEYEYMGAEYTHKMMNLLYLYRDDILGANVTTDSRLNVRDTNGTHGNILFQVTKQNNILFVDKDSSNKWYRVRFVYDKSTNTISSVNEGYVMGKYIGVGPLSYGDRQSLITVFSK